MKYLRFIPFIFLFSDACIDPLQVPLSSSGSVMMVDGMITNMPGPYTVKLMYSSNLENNLRTPVPVSGASLLIVNNLNETESLNEISPGIYQSSAEGMQGQFGLSYYLRIVTPTGEYQSDAQTLISAGSIEDVFIEFSADGVTDYDGSETDDSFKVYINSKGVEGDLNLYRWRWTGIHKVKAYPELYEAGDGQINPRVPAPWLCSGYVFENGALLKVRECECCTCWSYNYSTSALVSDPRFVRDEFKKIAIGSVGITPMNFYERYFIEVEQLSISEAVYNFWKLVEDQQKALGSLFQPNLAKIKGNIKCVSDPQEKVLGIFSVSGVTKKSIFIEPEAIPYPLAGIDTIKYDCRTAFKNATTEKPLFW